MTDLARAGWVGDSRGERSSTGCCALRAIRYRALQEGHLYAHSLSRNVRKEKELQSEGCVVAHVVRGNCPDAWKLIRFQRSAAPGNVKAYSSVFSALSLHRKHY